MPAVIQETISALLEVLRPCKIAVNESVANLVQVFQKELNFKPSEISNIDDNTANKLQEKREKKTFLNVEKKYQHMLRKEKMELCKKAIVFLDFTAEGGRKKALFLLNTLKTFNLVLEHNMADIYSFFDPNCFSPALALAREVWFYLKVYLNDLDIIYELASEKTKTTDDLSLAMQIFNQIVRLFNLRLAYKDEQEQSKEFKNMCIIETILMLFSEKNQAKLMSEICPVLVTDTVDKCKSLFQHICGLVGSFDFLLKHITEEILWSSSLEESLLVRCLTFCINSCYQNEARKKFLSFVRSCLTEIKAKDLKHSSNQLTMHYGNDTYSNLLQAIKEKQETNNALEFILNRALTIRDNDYRTAVSDLLQSIAQFGDYYIISCATRFVCLKTTREYAQLESLGRTTRELGNCIRLLCSMATDPYYKSMFLAEDVFRCLDPVLKYFLKQNHKEEEFPIFEAYKQLFNVKLSINNETSSQNECKYIDPISRNTLADFCKHCSDYIFRKMILLNTNSITDTELGVAQNLAALMEALQGLFNYSFNETLFYREFQNNDDSCLHQMLVVLTSVVPGLVRADHESATKLVTAYLRMVASVFVPTVLTKDTYKGKRFRYACQLLANTKDSEKCVSTIESLLSALKTCSSELYFSASIIWQPIESLVSNSSQLESAYKTAEVYQEKDLVKKMSYYDSLYEKTYNLDVGQSSRGLELVQETIMGLSKINEYRPVEVYKNRPAEQSLPIIEFTMQSSNPSDETEAIVGSSTQTRYIDSTCFGPLATARPVYVGTAGRKVEPPKGVFKPNSYSSPFCVISQKSTSTGALPSWARRTDTGGGSSGNASQNPVSNQQQNPSPVAHQPQPTQYQYQGVYAPQGTTPGPSAYTGHPIGSRGGTTHSALPQATHASSAVTGYPSYTHDTHGRTAPPGSYTGKIEHHYPDKALPESAHGTIYDGRQAQQTQPHGQMYPTHPDPYAAYAHTGYPGAPYGSAGYPQQPGVPQPGTSQSPDIMEAFHRNLMQYSYGNGTQDYYSMAGGTHNYSYPGGYMQPSMYYQDAYGNPVVYPGYNQMNYSTHASAVGTPADPTQATLDPRHPQGHTHAYYMADQPPKANDVNR